MATPRQISLGQAIPSAKAAARRCAGSARRFGSRAMSLANRPPGESTPRRQPTSTRRAKAKRTKLPDAPDTAGRIGKDDRKQGDRHKTGENDAVGQPVDGDRGEHGGELQIFTAGDEPGARHRAEAEGDEDGQEVAGHDRTEEVKCTDRTQRIEELTPLPGTHELLGHDGERDERDETRVSAGENGEEAVEIEAAQQPGQCSDPDETADPGQPTAAVSAFRDDLGHPWASTLSRKETVSAGRQRCLAASRTRFR